MRKLSILLITSLALLNEGIGIYSSFAGAKSHLQPVYNL
ncbi:hypothetical protein AN415_03908 [Acinetobacter baumannii]|uniref:Uncharacterized protein n=1 Tax=Acinetobacter baumannii MRSN 3527 TaxID=1409923 RepID=A0A0J1A8C0_ACIBA|nr:hypothetical protein AN415_03908 [Acinetobacter baumannii]KLT90751.1 hypothetical protein T630_0088 [Acinetobacter baumannii MRSN 3527]